MATSQEHKGYHDHPGLHNKNKKAFDIQQKYLLKNIFHFPLE